LLSQLFIRELLLFVTIALIGAGPALLLRSGEATITSRLALAPGFGLAIGAGVLMLVDFFVPLRHAWFFTVVPLAAIGLAMAMWSARRDGLRLRVSLRGLVAITAIGLVAAGVGNYALHGKYTLAPVGYGVFDAPGYVTYIEGYESRTNDKPLAATPGDWTLPKYNNEAWNAPWDLAQRYGWAYKFQHTSSDAVAATVTGLGGWAPWTMLSAFMVVLFAAGALGAYGLAGVVGVRGLPQVLAGLLYAGPVVYTVMNDGSQGLLAGLAVLPAVISATILAFERPGKRSAALAGVAFGGLQAVYPELLAGAIAGLGLGLVGILVLAWGRRARRPITRAAVLRVAGLLALAAVAGAMVAPRTLPWTWNYVAAGSYKGLAKGVIHYNMELRFLPGWLYQTREFYTFAFLRPSGIVQTLVGTVLPLVLIVVSGYAFVALRRARFLIGLIVFLCAQALVTSSTLHCTYCAQRTLLALSPIVPVLLAGGLGALMALGGRRRDLGVALGTLALVVVIATGWTSMQRFRTGLISMPSNRLEKLADAIHNDTSGGIAMEGFDAVPLVSWLELPVAYNMVKQANPQRISIIADANEYGGFSFYGTRPADDPSWSPDYKWVLSRLGGFDHSRQEIFRQGPISLQRRVEPFDVIVESGVAVDQQSLDAAGVPWIQTPHDQMQLHQDAFTLRVAASDPGTAYVRFELHGGKDLRVKKTPGMVQKRPAEGVLEVCVPATGPAKTRQLTFDVGPDTGALTFPAQQYVLGPSPAKAIQLFTVGATPAPCRSRGAPDGA
jgi:hypothetical protein